MLHGWLPHTWTWIPATAGGAMVFGVVQFATTAVGSTAVSALPGLLPAAIGGLGYGLVTGIVLAGFRGGRQASHAPA